MTNDTLWKEGVLAVLHDGVLSRSNASRTVLLKEIKNAFKGPQHFSDAFSQKIIVVENI